MFILKNLLNLDLFLFDSSTATTATTSTEASEGTATGVTVQDAAVQTGDNTQDAAVKEKADQPKSREERTAEFEKLIKGEYKDLYGERMQKTIQERLKGSKETKEKLNLYQPAIEAALERYGVKDVSELPKAIALDKFKLEHEAMEKGVDVEQLRQEKQQEYDNKLQAQELNRLKAEKEAGEKAVLAEKERQKTFKEWHKQEQELKKDFPNFTIAEEIKNPDFADLLKRGVDVKKAYYATHHDDILSEIAKHAVTKGKKDAVDTIKANKQRPSENISSTAAPDIRSDPKKYTDDYWDDVDKRVEKGEKIPIP